VIRSVSILSLGGFQFGYNTGIISGAILFIAKHFSLSLAEEGIAVSAILISALLGSALAGTAADYFGRRKTTFLSVFLFLVGACTAAAASNFTWLLAGRLISGVAVGLVSVISPMYIAEIAPPGKRGKYVSVNQLAVTFGIFTAYGCNYLLAPNWQLMFLSAAIPAILQGILLFAVKESPVQGAPTLFAWRELLSLEKIFWISIGLMVFQQITGINSVIYFSPKIFEEAGLSLRSSAILATMGVGAVNVLATIVSLYLVDRVGRRPLILWSLAGMTLSLLTIALGLYTEIAAIDKIALLTLMGYVAFFAIGLGPLPALIISELAPSDVRGQALSLATLANWLFNFVVVFSFLKIQAAFSAAGAFCLYAFFAVLAFALFYRSLPETKNVALK